MRPSSSSDLSDDLNFDALTGVLQEQSAWLRKTNGTMHFGPKTVSAASYADKLDGLIDAIAGGGQAATTYLQQNFVLYDVYGADDWGKVRLTSYFEPVIKGSRRPTADHPEPVLKRPDDLLTIATNLYWDPIKGVSSMRGRMDPKKPNRVVPYFSRAEIAAGALKDRQLALAYVDPIEAFFMQVQGSGSIDFDDGATLRVGYADQNGHPYKAIGSLLLDVIPKEKMSMDAIVAHLHTLHAAARNKILDANPSYVFFEERHGPALTSNTTAAIGGRTIATDAKYFPKGALALLRFIPPGRTDKTARLVADQDSGGAIKGGGRVDLFWGRGKEAGSVAGTIDQTAELAYLVPR